MLGKRRVLALALAFTMAPAGATAQQGASNGNSVTVVADRETDDCPIPDVVAANELALGCGKDLTGFLVRLRSDSACGPAASYSSDQACAVIIYTLDPNHFGQRDLPPTMTVKVGRITTPP